MPRNKAYTKARKIVDLLLAKKAQNILLMDLRKITNIADYFVICHGESDIHVKALAEAVVEGMEKTGEKVWHQEGMSYLHWVLLDYVDIVVHIFQKPERDFYGLERLWADAEIEPFVED